MALRFVSPAEGGAPGFSDHVIGGFLVAPEAGAPGASWPLQQVQAPVLAQHDRSALQELWLTDGPCAEGASEGIRWRRSGDVLFGVVELAEGGVVPQAGQRPLQTLCAEAYARIFRLLDAQGLSHLWRVWNYLADITGECDGLERYRQFNLGRAQAFEHAARSVTGRVPAACAIGVESGPLSIAFFAGATPLVTIENPRQVSAFLYPAEYGPRAPIFSRAALAYPPGQEYLFVSGTASIVGHASLHPGQVQAQAQEALANVAALLAEAKRHSRTGGFSMESLNYRVYVRHAADLAAVRAVMQAHLGAATVAYVQADICRRELLVELEAVGCQPCPDGAGPA